MATCPPPSQLRRAKGGPRSTFVKAARVDRLPLGLPVLVKVCSRWRVVTAAEDDTITNAASALKLITRSGDAFHLSNKRDFALQNEFRMLLVVHVMADLMKPAELKDRLKKIPEWELEKKHIERTFEFDDFADAIDFVNAVSEVAEEEEHHPDIDIRYNKVRLVLSTHSKGGLTELDFGLAERIDTLAE